MPSRPSERVLLRGLRPHRRRMERCRGRPRRGRDRRRPRRRRQERARAHRRRARPAVRRGGGRVVRDRPLRGRRWNPGCSSPTRMPALPTTSGSSSASSPGSRWTRTPPTSASGRRVTSSCSTDLGTERRGAARAQHGGGRAPRRTPCRSSPSVSASPTSSTGCGDSAAMTPAERVRRRRCGSLWPRPRRRAPR